MQPDPAAQFQRLGEIVETEVEGIHRGILHPESGDQALGEHRLQLAGLGRRDRMADDPAARAQGRKVGDIGFIVALHRHEEPARILDAVTGQALEQGALFAALDRRGRIAAHVARPAVQQPVVGAGSAGGDVPSFDQKD